MSFQGGQPPNACTDASTASAPSLQLQLLRKCGGAAAADQLQLHAETDQMRYTGTNHGRGSLAGSGAAQRYVLGVYRKSRGTVELYRGTETFMMHGEVKAPLVDLGVETPAAETPAADTPASEGGVAKQGLVSELGADRARKRQRSALAKRVEAGAVFNDATLAADVSDALIGASVPEGLTAEQERPCHPPFKLGAPSVAEAYPIDGIVPPHILRALDSKILNTAASAPPPLPGQPTLWPPFVVKQHAALPAGEHGARQKMLLYLAYMLRFRSITGPFQYIDADDADEKTPPLASKLSIPPLAWHQLVSDFAADTAGPARASPKAQRGAGTRRITQPMAQKLAMHGLALALLASEGRLPFGGLGKAFGLTDEKCTLYLKQLGCSLEKVVGGQKKGEKLVVLNLPLSLPESKRRITRRSAPAYGM